jgi:hypothetical protein
MVIAKPSSTPIAAKPGLPPKMGCSTNGCGSLRGHRNDRHRQKDGGTGKTDPGRIGSGITQMEIIDRAIAIRCC